MGWVLYWAVEGQSDLSEDDCKVNAAAICTLYFAVLPNVFRLTIPATHALSLTSFHGSGAAPFPFTADGNCAVKSRCAIGQEWSLPEISLDTLPFWRGVGRPGCHWRRWYLEAFLRNYLTYVMDNWLFGLHWLSCGQYHIRQSINQYIFEVYLVFWQNNILFMYLLIDWWKRIVFVPAQRIELVRVQKYLTGIGNWHYW